MSEVINALNICQKARTAIISINDIISTHKPRVNDAEFADQVYNYFLTNQDDLGTLIKDLKTLNGDRFKLMLTYKQGEVSNVIYLLLTTYKNDKNYWIQFEDVDILVNRTRILMKTATELQEKQDLLEFAINLSVEFNRWLSMQIVISMLHDLTDADIKSMALFITNNKDNINTIKNSVSNPLPKSVNAFLR